LESDAEINQKIRAYEDRTGTQFTEHERTDIRTGRKAQGAEPRKELHPLGHHATPGLDHRTRANRNAVASVLREYFAGTLDRDKLNKPVERSDSRTGAELADRVTSRFELASALNLLNGRNKDLWLVVVRHYRDNITREQIADRWHQSPKTVRTSIEAALDVLIERLWIDPT
jgi:hypothetical protein